MLLDRSSREIRLTNLFLEMICPRMFKSVREQNYFKLFKKNYSKKMNDIKSSKQIYSAIQPTGEVHLGNYLGAISKWVLMQNDKYNTVFSIADLHSLTSAQDPQTLQENIFLMAATLLACGIDPNKSILFQQSAVHQHSELCWIFTTLSTISKLSHMHQFKEKSESMKEVSVGLFLYPMLQVADIALYKTTHVPVGVDQTQHIELANRLLRTFNRKYGKTFPSIDIVIDRFAGNIKSLSQPNKKMSKSGSPKSYLSLMDTPDDIIKKCKKAVTDFTSKVTFEPETRPGISNLILIHSQLTNKSVEDICKEAENMDTGKYKLHLAEVIIEHLKPICEQIKQYMSSREYLRDVLCSGAEKASERAELTMKEVREKIGLNIKSEEASRVKIEIGKFG